MRIAIIGQVAFGEAVSTALRDAGSEIVAVTAPPETGGKPDPLWASGQAAGVAGGYTSSP